MPGKMVIPVVIVGCLFGCIALGVLAYVPGEELAAGFRRIFATFEGSARLTLVVAALTAVVMGLTLSGFFVWRGLMGVQTHRYRAQLAAAEALKAERDARFSVTVAPPGHQVIGHEFGLNVVHKPLHLAAGRVNGADAVPSLAEVQRWAVFHLAHASPRLPANGNGATAAGGPLLTGPAPDLLAELDNVQRCLIVGASDVGKTTLLQHIMARRLAASKVVAIDPHAYPGKWPAHKTFGTGRNYREVSFGLEELLKLMNRRYDDIGQGLVREMGHSKITVVIDEWRAIVHNIKESGEAIAALLTESRKAAFCVFVATHSERVKALGLDGEGDLKDGFAIVRLSIVNGQRSATIDRGSGEIPVSLPGRFQEPGPATSLPAPGNDVALLEPGYRPEPTSLERMILDMAAAGESRAKICEVAFGYKSSKKYPEIDAVLEKFGVHRAPGFYEA